MISHNLCSLNYVGYETNSSRFQVSSSGLTVACFPVLRKQMAESVFREHALLTRKENFFVWNMKRRIYTKASRVPHLLNLLMLIMKCAQGHCIQPVWQMGLWAHSGVSVKRVLKHWAIQKDILKNAFQPAGKFYWRIWTDYVSVWIERGWSAPKPRWNTWKGKQFFNTMLECSLSELQLSQCTVDEIRNRSQAILKANAIKPHLPLWISLTMYDVHILTHNGMN